MWFLSDWPESIEKSPYVWYSVCLSYNSSGSAVNLSLNGIKTFGIVDKTHFNGMIIPLNSTLQVSPWYIVYLEKKLIPGLYQSIVFV